MLRLIGLKPFQTSKQIKQIKCNYHSENGVYGYKPKSKRDFQVPEDVLQSRNSQSNVYRWVEAFRKHGHKLATVNSISVRTPPSSIDELKPKFYGLQGHETISLKGLINLPQTTHTEHSMSIDNLQNLLKQLYCGSAVSAEFSYIENLEEREWLAKYYEELFANTIEKNDRKKIAELLIKSQVWDNFMASKYPTVKRYSGEGAESLFAFFWQLLRNSTEEDLKHIVVAMPHRGRTELQTVLLNMRPAKVFRKLSGESEFAEGVPAMSDVISHFHTSEDLNINGKPIRFSLIRNPSHLEAANPVSMGKARSKQQTSQEGAYSTDKTSTKKSSVLNVILHGDAAFAGQGINQECLNMAYVPHFDVGGTIHLIVNNQVGFTTPAERGRSTDYTSDLAKTIQAPVFHVNADDPENVALVTQLAFAYQKEFGKDVFIDMNCFRQWGHNELDDPTFTNPSVYQIINQKKSIPDTYTEKLAQENILTPEEAEIIRKNYTEFLNTEMSNASSYVPPPSFFEKQWTDLKSAPNAITYWDTGLEYSLLNYIGQQSVSFPKDFNIHPHLLKTHVEGRRKKLDAGEKIDWATAEALAIGSLLYQGHNVRISGEDVGRGTFSHRHVMLVDQKTNQMYIPLNDLKGGHDGKLEIAHSILSEEAVLGFEYGMAIDNPNNLIIWEAQFGDFANGAQIIIDNFIATGETKWMDSNALVMLLPHGFDGAASEHSSCRLERFLQLTDSKETSPDGDDVNLHIVNPTTPAQYYHVLRRQLLRDFRKPLIVVAPKTLLRLSAATSKYTDFVPGSHFQNVLGDVNIHQADKVQKVILCCGKHYYNLAEERHKRAAENVALIRIESLCPFPLHEIQQELEKYKNVKTFIWSQEEHRNMGAWSFIRPRFEYLIGKQIHYCGRAEAPTIATGIGKVHKKEAEEVVAAPFKF